MTLCSVYVVLQSSHYVLKYLNSHKIAVVHIKQEEKKNRVHINRKLHAVMYGLKTLAT